MEISLPFQELKQKPGKKMDIIQTSLDFKDNRKSELKDCITKAISDEDSIENMIFENEVLTESDVSNIEFEKVKFIKCCFKKCNFYQSRFFKTDFIKCDVSLSDFSESFWKNSLIMECNAVGGGSVSLFL